MLTNVSDLDYVDDLEARDESYPRFVSNGFISNGFISFGQNFKAS